MESTTIRESRVRTGGPGPARRACHACRAKAKRRRADLSRSQLSCRDGARARRATLNPIPHPGSSLPKPAFPAVLDLHSQDSANPLPSMASSPTIHYYTYFLRNHNCARHTVRGSPRMAGSRQPWSRLVKPKKCFNPGHTFRAPEPVPPTCPPKLRAKGDSSRRSLGEGGSNATAGQVLGG